MSQAVPQPELVAKAYLHSEPAFSACAEGPEDMPLQVGDSIFGKLIVADGDVDAIYLGRRRAYFHCPHQWLHERYGSIRTSVRQVPFRANGWLDVEIGEQTLAVFRANPSLFQVERFFRKCALADTPSRVA